MNLLARNPLPKMLVCLALVAAWSAAITLPAVAADGEIPEVDNPASDNPALKYLPEDYTALATADVKILMRLMGTVKNNPQSAQFTQALQAVKLFTGIDFENDVDSIVAFSAGDVEEKKWLGVLQGSFDNGEVETTLANSPFAGNFKKSTHKSKTVYTGPDIGFYFPADSTLAVGNPDLIRATIDKLDADADPELPASLQTLLDRTNGESILWGATRVGDLVKSDAAADWRAGNPELSAQLGKIELLSLSSEMAGDGLLIDAVGYAPGSGNSKSVYEFFDTRRDSLLKVEGSNVFIASLLILAELTNDGDFTRGQLRLTLPALQELWGTKVIVKPE